LEKLNKTTKLRITDLRAEIWTLDIPNTNHSAATFCV
jgi:hypothetical protein